MESAVQVVAAAHVVIVRDVKADTDAVSKVTKRVDPVAASIPSSAVVSGVVVAAHHLRLRGAEMAAGATTAALIRRRIRLLVIGRTMPPTQSRSRRLSVGGSWLRSIGDGEGVVQVLHDLATCQCVS
jgi:hypothetical protein